MHPFLEPCTGAEIWSVRLSLECAYVTRVCVCHAGRPASSSPAVAVNAYDSRTCTMSSRLVPTRLGPIQQCCQTHTATHHNSLLSEHGPCRPSSHLSFAVTTAG